MFLLWYDDSKKTPAQKLEGARAAYYARFARYPTVAMVNAKDETNRADMRIRVESYVRPNNVWVGEE